MKLCKHCGNILDDSNFRVKNGKLYYICKSCEKEYNKKYESSHRVEINNRHKEYMKQYSKEHREQINDYAREYQRNRLNINPENFRGKNALQRGAHPYTKAQIIKMSRYGLSPEEFDSLPDHCEICGSVENLCIDHDHITGRVRGTLCGRCNTALGMLQEDVERMGSMINYIKRFKNETISLSGL